MPVCYIGIGSNLGDRRGYINLAIDRIRRLKGTKVLKISSTIETEPFGAPPQPKFMNAAIEIQTDLSSRALLSALQKIETELGRVRTVKNGPRTIDLDILFYGEEKLNDADLVIPHSRIRQREFVLRPLREIAPAMVEKFLHENNQKN